MTGKKRILHVIWSGTTGGIEMQVYQLCQAQASNRRLAIELLICKNELPGELMEGFQKNEFRIHFAHLVSGMDFSPSKYRYLRNLFSQFDIIHLHAYNPLVAKAARRSGVSVLFTVHGNFGFGRPRRMTEHLTNAMLRHFLNNHVQYITFNSEFTRDESLRRYGLKGVPVQIVPNGVSFDHLNAEGDGDDQAIGHLLKDQFVVGVVARFVEVKRIDRLLGVFARFAEDKRASLLLVGDGPMRPTYERIIKNLNIREKVILAGFRKHNFYFHNLMDVHVLPSIKEAFGLSAVEALYAGNPVLVYADGGAPTGLVRHLEPDDVVAGDTEMEQRLHHYFQMRGDITRLAVQRREYAAAFNITNTECKFDQIYQLTDVRH